MPADLPPPVPAIEITVATTGMSKGISQTEGPQLVIRPSLRFGKLQAGAQWKNLTSPTAKGEGAAFLSTSTAIWSLQVSAGIAWKFQTGASGSADPGGLELTASASRKLGPVTLRVNSIYSPDDLGSTGESLYVEAGPAVTLGRDWTVSAAIGHRGREGAPGYSAFNFGIGKSRRGAKLDLRLYATDRPDLGSPYKSRIVGSLKFAF